MIRKTACLLIFLAGLTLSASAQNSVDELFKDATVFYLDRYELPAHVKDSIYLVRVIKRDSTDVSLYNVEDYYLNGHRAMAGKTHVPLYNLVKQGVFIRYYRNGHRKSVESFDKGLRVGDGSYYYPNGILYYIGYYDVSTSKWNIKESRDSTGSILAADGTGTYVEYSDDFKAVKASGPIVHGLKEGKWSGIVSDTASYVCSYNQGNSYSGVTKTKSGNIIHFSQDHVAPEFPGGEKVFSKFLAKNMRYPVKAKENHVQGKVLVSFVVNEDGKLSDFRVLRGPGGGLDDEALKVMKMSPSWNPGIEFGIVSKIAYTIPISFTLQEEN